MIAAKNSLKTVNYIKNTQLNSKELNKKRQHKFLSLRILYNKIENNGKLNKKMEPWGNLSHNLGRESSERTKGRTKFEK